jgi:hypothetical protein
MAYTVTLSDDEFAALVAASARTGASIEQLVHQAIADQIRPLAPAKPIGTYIYPSGALLSAGEEAEMERLAQEIGSDRPWASEMAIEDRGPR